MKKEYTPRRRILVDRSFQLGILLRLAGSLVLCFTLALALLLAAPVALAMRGDAPAWLLDVLHDRFVVLKELVAAPLVCSLLVFFAHGLYETFRIAGPLTRIAEILAQLRELRIPAGIAVRKRDHLARSVAQLDAALGSLSRHLQACQEASARVLASAPGAQQGDSQAATEHDRAVTELHALLQQFQLEKTGNEEPVEPLPEDEVTTTLADLS